MCLSCFDPSAGLPGDTGAGRRDFLRKLAAAGLSVPLAAHLLSRPAGATPASFLDRTRFLDGLEGLLASADVPELVAYRRIDITGADLPWIESGLEATKGQQITFLLGGRMWLSREYDLWFEPGVVFHARSGAGQPIYNPMANTGTMTATADGPVQIARSAGEWASEAGDLWVPDEEYAKADVALYGYALLWKGSAAEGLARLADRGDVGGVIGAELARVTSPKTLPAGWENLYMFGGGPVIFSDGGNGEIVCQSHKTVGILRHETPLPLVPDTRLSWRWIVEELPSVQPEDSPATHDYLSIGVEFDDGQDFTYIWSRGLPVGKVFRCPLPRWTPIETHKVVRSGTAEIGTWLGEEQDVYADYQAHIGGEAKNIVRVWLLGVTVFQRRSGQCRYSSIRLTHPAGEIQLL